MIYYGRRTRDKLPDAWRKRLAKYLRDKGVVDRELPYYYDFPDETVKVVFEDGSLMEFKNAFFLRLATRGEIGVFTEHCGYFIFEDPEDVSFEVIK